jgi:hypothetical protein
LCNLISDQEDRPCIMLHLYSIESQLTLLFHNAIAHLENILHPVPESSEDDEGSSDDSNVDNENTSAGWSHTLLDDDELSIT